jgi:hypothetical protein
MLKVTESLLRRVIMELVENAAPIENQFSAEEFAELRGCKSVEEFVDFVTELWSEGEGLSLYHDDIICYVYVASQKLLYYGNIKPGTDEPKVDPKKDSKGKKVKGSNVFFTSLLALLVLLSSMPIQYVSAAGYFSGSLKEDSTVYPGISTVDFYVSGEKSPMNTRLSTVESDEYTATAYTFGDPRMIQDQSSVSLISLPRSVTEGYLFALLAFPQKFNTTDVNKTFGIQATDAQVKAATQLSVWAYGSSLQLSYQIDVNSVNDATVRALSNAINGWASDQIKALPATKKMADYLFPFYEPKLATSSAKMNRTDTTATFGPYTITGQSGSIYTAHVPGGAIVDSTAKAMTQVTSGQQFFVSYPSTYAGSQAITFTGVQRRYSVNYGKDRVWIDKAPENVEVKFQLNTAAGSKGMIEITTVDAITQQPLQGVSVQISNSSPITTVTTNDQGKAEFSGDVGDYTLTFTTSQGYIQPDPKQVRIGFSGDVQIANIPVAWSQAIANFHAVDAQTLAPAGSSEAFIYDTKGKPIKRIAIKDGVVNGITLPAGSYNLVQYKSSGAYGINTGTSFEVVAGKVTDVTVTQVPNVQPATVTVTNAVSTDTWIYTFSLNQKTLFQIKGYNSVVLNLPVGSYTVRAQKDDGSATTPDKNFSPTVTTPTSVSLEQEVGTETVSFNLVDTLKELPIPNVVLGLFDEKHNLLSSQTADVNGVATFKNVKKLSVYFVNVLAAPSDVSGYSADGNRFLGASKTIKLHLYSLAEIQQKTSADTLYRVANVAYSGATYTYPKVEVITPTPEPKRKKFLGIF